MKMLTKEEAAAEIAEFTYLVDEGTHAMYRAFAADEDAPDEPLKLLKVNADTPPMGILPLHFPPDITNGILFASLRLPDDWRIGLSIPHSNGLVKTAARTIR